MVSSLLATSVVICTLGQYDKGYIYDNQELQCGMMLDLVSDMHIAEDHTHLGTAFGVLKICMAITVPWESLAITNWPLSSPYNETNGIRRHMSCFTSPFQCGCNSLLIVSKYGRIGRWVTKFATQGLQKVGHKQEHNSCHPMSSISTSGQRSTSTDPSDY